MYHYKETERIGKCLCIVIALILVVGFVAGISYGIMLREPTEEALKALDEMNKYGWDVDLMLKAEEVTWGLNSTMALFGIWIGSAISALLLYSKKHHLDMIDRICASIKKTEDENIVETEE